LRINQRIKLPGATPAGSAAPTMKTPQL
jgi:hypothetical protein